MLFFVELFIDFAVLSVLYTFKRNNTNKLEQPLYNLPRHPAALQGTIIFHVFRSNVCVGKVYEAESAFKIIKHSSIVSHHVCRIS